MKFEKNRRLDKERADTVWRTKISRANKRGSQPAQASTATALGVRQVGGQAPVAKQLEVRIENK